MWERPPRPFSRAQRGARLRIATEVLCHTCSMSRPSGTTRDLAELILGYGFIVGIIWMPEPLQRMLSPIALVATFLVVMMRRRNRSADDADLGTIGDRDDSRGASIPTPGPLKDAPLGFGLRGLVPSLWILPAAVALAAISIFIAAKIGTLHSLYKGDFRHVTGYILWTTYQQFLLQDYFMPRAARILSGETAAIALTAVLFALAHQPNLPLTAATLVWGAVSCLLFRRYRNLYALGLAQGLLGLCFAICVPDSLSHHLRVGLGYLRYRPTPPAP